MLRIALTGGIGSGKTAVTQHLSALGVPVLDADDFSHQATRAKEPAVLQIAKVFGPGVLNASGNLDRAALRQMIFADKGKRKQLEAILHPEIRKRMNEAASTLDAPYAVFSIPLLIETGQATDFDFVLVIEAPAALRAQRVGERSGLSAEAFRAITDAQASDAQRRQAADEVIINDGSLQALRAQVDALHRRLQDLAQ